MRIAFLIQAHCNPPQIAALIARLEQGGHRAFVHYDAKAGDDLSAFADRLIIPRITVHHGGFSQVQATLHIIHEALSHGPFDYFMLLSGQCFPVNETSWLEKCLVDGRVFLNSRAMPTESQAKRLDRLEHHHFEGEGAINRALNKMSRRLPKRNIVKGLSLWPHAGSNWWCLPVDVINFILRYIERNDSFVRYLRTTSYVDEVFFHSILSTMAIEDRLMPALFYARFDPATHHPIVFTPETVGSIPRDKVFVARKFDTRVDPFFLEMAV